MADITLGNLYELNQEAMKKVDPINFSELQQGKKVIKAMFAENSGGYYMLLNRERADYTVFEIPDRTYAGEMAKECIDCLKNRGQILSIEREAPEVSAIELWIRDIDNTNYLYMLFPCDAMIISPRDKTKRVD